jgi:phage gp46-like protein
MADLKMIETGDGGDYVLRGSDLVLIEGFENMPYLALFGGNVESSTREFRPTEQRFDWWGNTLLMLNNSAIQMNSETERILNNSALTSSTRLQIEQAIKTDLEFFKGFSTITISASITATDRVEINVQIIEPDTQDSTEFVYIWDSTERELTLKNLN